MVLTERDLFLWAYNYSSLLYLVSITVYKADNRHTHPLLVLLFSAKVGQNILHFQLIKWSFWYLTIPGLILSSMSSGTPSKNGAEAHLHETGKQLVSKDLDESIKRKTRAWYCLSLL